MSSHIIAFTDLPSTTPSQFLISSVRVSVHATRPLNTLALLLLPILCAVGLIGNAFVCVAIATDRRLHNVTNYFLFSLALADLLVCCIVMPLSIVVEVRHGVWTWNFSMCLLYVYADVFLCSASIVHMSVISLDRYLGISQPLKTRNKSKTMIFIKITLVWIITVLISCPLAVVALHDPSNVLQNNSCMVFNRYYMLYGSTLSFLIPFFIMTITYVRTTNLLNKQARILSEKASEGTGDGLRRTMPNHRKLGYCRTNSGLISAGNGNTKKPLLRYASVGEQEMERLLKKESTARNGEAGKDSSRMSSAFYRWKTMTTNCLQALTSKVTKKASLSSANQELANEHKATRVLAVVFVCFFICWTPFFIANFTYGFCGEACELPPWMGSVFLWLGYISSTINPLIYTIFNKRFRQAFVRILRCQCFHSLRDPYSFYSRHTTILPDTYYTCLLPLAYHVSSNAERATSREENGVGDGMTTRKEAAEFLMRSIRQKYPGSKIDQWISEGPSSPDQNGGKIEIGSRRGTRAITLDGPLPPPLPRPVTMVRRSMTSIGTSMITSNHSMFHSASSDWVTASMENSTNNKEKTDDSINEWIDSSNECPCPVLSTARASLMETSATTTTSCSTSGGSPSMILFNTVFSRPVRETFL